VVPSDAGGGADLSFRALARALEPLLGQRIEIVNNAASSGIDAMTAVANAKPDGYTLAATWNGPLTGTPQVTSVPYTLDSFTPIASVFEADIVLCARADFPAENGKELVGLLRQKPLGYTYGNEGLGGISYFAAERVFSALGVLIRAESYNGSVENTKALAEKKTDLYAGTPTTVLPHVRKGAVKCLLVLSDRRSAVLPQATTLVELGIGAEASYLWRMILAPRGISAEVRLKLQTSIRMALATPDMGAFLKENGDRAIGKSGLETAERLRKEYDDFALIGDLLGVKRYELAR
jgi:tripartite-type tricarboxylate transporter receptor subunit TctC